MIRIITLYTSDIKRFTKDPIYDYLQSGSITEGIRQVIGSEGPDDDIIGVLWGGRYPVRNDQPLTGPYIEKILKNHDLILPYEGVVAAQIWESITENLSLLKESRIADIIGRIADSRMMFEPGMIIGRYGIIKHLLTDAMQLAGDMEDELRSALIIKALVISEGIKVKSESISHADPELWNTGYDRIDVLRNYMDVMLGEYINLRQSMGFEDSFAEEDPYKGDFEGKIPVWICWWQGLGDAPDLVKACTASVMRNLPDSATCVVITMDNWSEYVSFTDAIIDKFNRQIISYTHLADALRTELLYRYGGMWIDATYYVSGLIHGDVLQHDFYSTAFRPELWGMDVMEGRWSSSLLGSRDRHNPVMQFVMEGLWLYWEQNDDTIDYFFWDYILDTGYRHFDKIRDMIDCIPVSSPAVYELQLKMNQAISDKEERWLKETSVFYKINRRNEYHEKTYDGLQTFYGYIVNGATETEDYDFSETKILDPSTETSMINRLREINPYSILDRCGYFSSSCPVSRGILDDIIIHPLVIDSSDPAGDSYTNIYDNTGIVDSGGYEVIIGPYE